MIHELYRVLNFVLIIFSCLLISALQSVLLKLPALHWLELDMLLLVVVYLSLHRGFFEGTVLVFLIGRIVEIHSGAPAGLVISCYIAVFLAILFTKELFLVGTSFSAIILALSGGLIFKITFLILASRYGIFYNLWKSTLEYSIPYLLSLGVFSRAIFNLIKRIDILTKFDTESEARSLTGEEF